MNRESEYQSKGVGQSASAPRSWEVASHCEEDGMSADTFREPQDTEAQLTPPKSLKDNDRQDFSSQTTVEPPPPPPPIVRGES